MMKTINRFITILKKQKPAGNLPDWIISTNRIEIANRRERSSLPATARSGVKCAIKVRLNLHRELQTLARSCSRLLRSQPKRIFVLLIWISQQYLQILTLDAFDFQNQIRAVAFCRSLKTRAEISVENFFRDFQRGQSRHRIAFHSEKPRNRLVSRLSDASPQR